MDLTFNNVDGLCSEVDLSKERPIIDLSHVSFFHPFALIYLGMFLRHYNAAGQAFDMPVPINSAARNYLSRQNFFGRFNFSPEKIDPSLLRRFTSQTSINDVVDIERRPGIDEEIAVKVRKVVARSSAVVDLALVEEIVAELVSNFARHSQGPLAALAMQYYPRLHTIRIAVGDCGIGIRKSLSSNPNYASLSDQPHNVAALKAFQAGVSRSHEGGFGLTTVLDNVAELRGAFVLATGDGYVRRSESGPTKYGDMLFDLPGVQIQVEIPTR